MRLFRIAILVVAAVAIVLLTAGQALAIQAKNVAVSRVSGSSAVLVVKADVTADVQVEYGIAPGVYTTTKSSSGQVRHEVLIDSIPPSSTVYYRVTMTENGNPVNTVTLPEKSFHTTKTAGIPFSFAVAGDNRPAAYSTVQPAVWSVITGQMTVENLDFALHAGDIISGSTTDTLAQNLAKYDGFFSVTMPLTASVPLYTAVGNHEWINTASNRVGYEQEFTLPTNNGADAAIYGEEYYSFDHGDTHFIVLCTEIPGQLGLVTGNQKTWLAQDLAQNTRPWTVVTLHRPLFSGVHMLEPWMDTANVVGQQNKAELHALFRDNGVDVVFAGNEHYYLRHVEDGVQYVITGGAGSPLYNLPVFTSGDMYGAKTYEHVKVDETPTSLKLTAIDSTGIVLETLTLGSPSLGLSSSGAYWASFADYTAGDLSVDYLLTNSGPGDAAGVQLVMFTATAGVALLTSAPMPVGSIPTGQSVPFTVHYQVPPSLAYFQTTTYAVGSDLNNHSFQLPGPAPMP